MVEFHIDKLKRLAFVGMRYRPAPVVLHCGIQSGFKLAETAPDKVDLELRFSGFQLLQADQVLLDRAAQMMPNSKIDWALSGVLAIVVHKSLIASVNTWEGPEIQHLAPFVDWLFHTEFKVQPESLILDATPTDADEVSENMIMKIVALNLSCSEQTWHDMYRAHSLELTAGMEFYKARGGVMAVEPVGAEDISPNRVLN